MTLSEIITLARAGYKASEINKLRELEEKNENRPPMDKKIETGGEDKSSIGGQETETGGENKSSIDGQKIETEEKGGDEKTEILDSLQKALDESNAKTKELEEKLEKIQDINRHKDVSGGAVDVNEELKKMFETIL